MRRSAVGFAAAAVVCAVAGTWGIGATVAAYEQKIAEASRPAPRYYVAVAARDLYAGLPITEEDLYAVQMEPAYVPPGAFLEPTYVVGRVARERILANEVIRGERLADATANQGLNVVVPRGLRAMSVALRDGAAVAGFLTPGSLVDVLLTAEDGGDESTQTMLQAVYVLGVNSRMGSETAEDAEEARGRHAPTVTLLLDPADAERVAHATTIGQLRLTLRNTGDADPVDLAKDMVATAAPRAKAATAPVAALPTCAEVWIWHGGARTVLVVDEHGKPIEPGGCAPSP